MTYVELATTTRNGDTPVATSLLVERQECRSSLCAGFGHCIKPIYAWLRHALLVCLRIVAIPGDACGGDKPRQECRRYHVPASVKIESFDGA